MEEKPYQIERKDGTVVLNTTSFKAERRSVLHSGVFNRELASSLSAGVVIVGISFFFALCFKITVSYLTALVFLFAIFFVLFRVFVFRETVLETVFDRGKRTITVSMSGTAGSRVASYLLDELVGIRICHISMEPQNMDAVRLVERVAVQHGTVIPGFGKTEDFYTVELDLGREKVVVFSARERQGAEAVIAGLQKAADWLFLGTGGRV